MNILDKILFLSAVVCSTAFAGSVKLTKVKIIPVSESVLPGYEFDTDQAFKISSGALEGKYIFFALKKAEAPEGTIPRFIVADSEKIISSIQLPGVQDGWNIVQPQAVSIGEALKSDGAIRILAVLTMEPMSGRPDDYWDQPFVFDIKTDATIESNQSLNKAMGDMKPRIKTIKEIKKFLSASKKITH